MPLELKEILIRVGMAFLTGFILGFERESHGRAAGLRTMVLVCVAAAMATILSDAYYAGSFVGRYASATWHPDPARLAAGILTGIGFLGAGVILRQGNLVRGVTTASQIWFVTVLGLCYGSGQISLGLMGLVISILTVFGLRYIEQFMKRDWYASLTVVAKDGEASVAKISAVLRQYGVVSKNIEVDHSVKENTRTTIFSLRYKREHQLELPEQIVDRLLTLPGVVRVDWK